MEKSKESNQYPSDGRCMIPKEEIDHAIQIFDMNLRHLGLPPDLFTPSEKIEITTTKIRLLRKKGK